MTTDIQSNGHRAQATTREAPAYSIDDAMEETSRALHAVQAAGGDTRKLSAAHREGVLTGLCRALSLNPLTSPIIYLVLNGKEVLYVTRQATDQIAARLRLNRRTVSGPEVRDFGGTKMIFCQVEVTAPDGRSEMATATLPPGDLVNALMKCETKAKRRATLSIAGLGLLCEDELETIPGAHRTPRPGGDPRNTPPVDDDDTADALTPPTCADLAGLAAWYAGLGLGADDSVRGDEAVGLATDHLIALGYLLSGVEIHRALSGNLSGVLRHVHDVLAAESAPEGVARAYGAVRAMVADCEDKELRADCKRAAARYYGQRSSPVLKGKAAETALAAALAPKPPPPTGTDDPARDSSDPAAAIGATVAANAQHGAQASAEPRVVLDDEHRRPTPHKPEPWQLDDAAMRAHIAGKGSRTEIERAAACHGEHQGPAFLTLLAAQLVAIDRAYQRRVHGTDAAMSLTQALMVVERCALNGRWAREAKAAQQAA